MIEFIVYGSPAPQGSKRAYINQYTHKAQLVESSKAVTPWREAVKAARFSGDGMLQAPVPGPVRLTITFTLKKPASASKRVKTYPDKKPDLSKLVRSTEDALVDVGAIEDDSRIVELITRKVFPNEHEDALALPGARIRVEAYGSN